VVPYLDRGGEAQATYDLASIQADFSTVDGLRMTVGARNSAFALGLTLQGVVTFTQTMTRQHFYKSMTSFADHTVWQDVYHVPHEEAVLYVKFHCRCRGPPRHLAQGEVAMSRYAMLVRLPRLTGVIERRILSTDLFEGLRRRRGPATRPDRRLRPHGRWCRAGR
jgi:motility quorum-sensing regulator/GCU-specific mRNA interferase toxin